MFRSLDARPVLVAACFGLTFGCLPAPDVTPPEPSTPAAIEELSPEQILAASDLPPTLDAPLDGDEMGVTVHRLTNGMTVYISTDRQKPRFTSWIAVRTGSRNDPADSTGLAHYLEHMLFKGTDEYGTLDAEAEREHLERTEQLYAELRQADEGRRAEIFAEIDAHNQAMAEYAVPNEFSRMYSALGVEGINAFTSDEVTAYIADVPSNRLEAWARVEAERFADPVFRLFYTELEAVYEEKNLSIDRPESRMWETMLLALFPAHPYGTQPTIGVVEHLKSPAYTDMVQYFEDWYGPNNMAVLLAGDIDAKTALPVLERTLGQLPPRPIGTRAEAALPPISGRVAHELVAEGEQSVMLGWRTVEVKHEDEPVMVVLDWLMDNSSSGLLNLELELTQKVQDAGSWSTSLNDAGYFAISATLQQGQTHAEVEELILGVIAKLEAGEFSQAEIDAIKLHEDIRDKQALESNWGRVARMLDAFIERRSWAEVLARDQRLRAVTREDVIRVAKTYLGDDYVVINRKQGAHTVPNIDKPKITPIDIDVSRQSPFAAEVLAMPATELEPQWLVEGEHYQHLELPAGPLIVAHNARNDLFSLQYRFDRGHRKAEMLCVALELLERSGSGPTSAEDLQRRLHAIGTDVGFRCGGETSAIDIDGIDANLEQSVELVEQWLRDPSFDEGDLAKLRVNIISAREDELDDSDELGELLADYARFGEHSVALSRPSNAAIRKVRAKPLRKLLATFPDHSHRTLYFGPRAPAEVAEVVALGRRHKKTGPRKLRRFRGGVEGTTIYFLHKDVAKSAVSLAIPLGAQDREQLPVARYLAHYMGGNMSSLIFQEIREARGLAYYAFASVLEAKVPDDQWALIGGMGTQVDKTNEALTTYLELLRERPIEATRLEHTLGSLDADYRSSRIDPRWVVWLVDSWDQRGERADPRPWEWGQIQTLGVDDVQGFATGYAELPVIVSIVGDRTRIDLDALAQLGKVIEVEPEQLVSYGMFE
ncbi:Protease 3 precursor [Enhygromyxa salina]|uniref:Protease 3 n=1 Tax=Enhygromyxa salina TaxID=215803 RepID=A0A2S9XQ84_9BACT|nr:M16 family metallopeptidase [Enhygromyxa salina]PRP95023.1 Protease 3 precursor [Enhygromyxa salina]